LVVRGDELDAAVVRADAIRFHRRFPAWGRFGVSAFVAADEDEIDALCETKLRAWSTVVVFARSALETAGIEVVPTFRVPHVTLADPSLDVLTQKLLLCDHRVVVNPYHEPDIGPLEGQ
jgi:hypothetical protein